MEEDVLIPAALAQLDLVLGFFPRVDGRLTAILGIDIAMLGFLAVNTPAFNKWSLLMLVAIPPLLLIGLSLWGIYQCTFPNLSGGKGSLVYFSEIADMTEPRYVEAFLVRPRPEHARDVLAQVWRNSQILKDKFLALRNAHIFLGWALVPWVIAVIVFASMDASTNALFH